MRFNRRPPRQAPHPPPPAPPSAPHQRHALLGERQSGLAGAHAVRQKRLDGGDVARYCGGGGSRAGGSGALGTGSAAAAHEDGPSSSHGSQGRAQKQPRQPRTAARELGGGEGGAVGGGLAQAEQSIKHWREQPLSIQHALCGRVWAQAGSRREGGARGGEAAGDQGERTVSRGEEW